MDELFVVLKSHVQICIGSLNVVGEIEVTSSKHYLRVFGLFICFSTSFYGQININRAQSCNQGPLKSLGVLSTSYTRLRTSECI